MKPQLKFIKFCPHNGAIEHHGYTYKSELLNGKRVVSSQRFKCLKCNKTFSRKVIGNLTITERKPRSYDLDKATILEWKKIVNRFKFQAAKNQSNYLQDVEDEFNWSRRHTLFLIRNWLDTIQTFNKKSVKSDKRRLSPSQQRKYRRYNKVRPLLREPALWFILWKNHKKFLQSLNPNQKSKVKHFIKNVSKDAWYKLFLKLEGELNSNFNYYYQRVMEDFFQPYKTSKEFKESNESYKIKLPENYFRRLDT